MLRIISQLFVCLAMVATASASAALTLSSASSSAPTGVAVPFEVEGQYGSNTTSSTREMFMGRDLGGSANSDYVRGQQVWGNNVSNAFTLSLQGSTATLNIDGTVLSYSFSLSPGFDSLVFELHAAAGTEMLLSGLKLNGQSFANLDVNQKNKSSASTRWWTLSNVGDLSQGFSLTGFATMAWKGTPSSTGISFDISGLDTPGSVPEPASLLLLGLGAAGLGLRRRHS